MAAGLGIIGIILNLLFFLVGIVVLVCFIMVLVQMFKHEQNGLGIACIILAFCTGIGPLIAFVYGWIKAKEWDLKKVMLAWTVAIVLQVCLLIGAVVMVLGAAAAGSQSLQKMDFDSSGFNIDTGDVNIDFPPIENMQTEEVPATDGAAATPDAEN